MKIIGCNNTTQLVTSIVSKIPIEVIARDIERFPDGELSIKIYDDLYQKEVLIVHQLFPNVSDNMLQLMLLINAVKKRGAKGIHAVIPYLTYSRMDHKAELCHFISASCTALLLEAAGLSTLIAIDLHSSQIEGFFRIPVKNIALLDVFQGHLRGMRNSGVVVVSPDIGGKVRSASVSDFLGSEIAVLHKRRDGANNVTVSGIMGDVAGKHCVILDDIIGSGQTILTAIETLEAAQASSIEVIITHNLLGALDPNKLSYIASKVQKLSVSNSIVVSPEALRSASLNIVDVTDSIVSCIKSYF